MKKAWIILILLVVLGVVGMVIVGQILLKQQAATARVDFAEVERGDLVATVSAPGRVQATSSVDISAEVPGRIAEITVEEGDRVERGQVLLRLEDARYRSQVQQYEAQLRTARANLELSHARLEKAGRDLKREEQLHQNNLVSEERVDAARTDHRIIKAEVEARKQEVARTEAALEVSRDDLLKTVYRAPRTGIVSRRNVDSGENVVVGTMNNPGTVLLSIADMSRMEVEAEVDEVDVVHVEPGQKATLTVDAIPEETFEGTVVAVGSSGRGAAPGSDQAVSFEVVVAFGEADPRLRPGMTADVDIETRQRDDVLVLPLQSLVARSRGVLADDRAALEENVDAEGAGALDEETRREIVEGVYADREGNATFVEVETGITDGDQVEVAGELEPGDRVVAGPYKVLRTLKEGTRLKERGKGLLGG